MSIFFPKFHPELNLTERCWGRMKWHGRQYTDGKLSTLRRLLEEGLNPPNLSLALIRKFCRLQEAYLLAYKNGDDIVKAEKWIKTRRCHRSHLPMMDDALDLLYFPQYYRDDGSRVEQAENLVIEDVNHPSSDETEDIEPEDVLMTGSGVITAP